MMNAPPKRGTRCGKAERLSHEVRSSTLKAISFMVFD
jgi:hypothetical protein